MNAWTYDGGTDVHQMFDLSGEPPVSQLLPFFGTAPREQAKATDIAANNVAKREYQKEYIDYWNSTAELTGTGCPVDAIIAPVAPFAAARPGLYNYFGYSTFVNLLDYSSCVVPVTVVDKKIDVVNKEFKPLSNQDEGIQNTCKFSFLFFFFPLPSFSWPLLTNNLTLR